MGITVFFCLVSAYLYPRFKQTGMEARYLKTRHVVETAWGIVDYYAKQVKADAVPLEEAKRRAMETVKNRRYEKDNGCTQRRLLLDQ
jgi:methyl-accepting chemotaxis protein